MHLLLVVQSFLSPDLWSGVACAKSSPKTAPKALQTTPAAPLSSDKVFEYYQSLGDFSSAFTQVKRLAAEGVELQSSGHLRVSPRRAILWEVEKPAPMAAFLDSQRLKLQFGAGASKKMSQYDLKDAAFSEKMAASMKDLTALLAFDRQAWESQYTLEWRQHQATLTPKAPGSFTRIHMFFHDHLWVERIDIEEKSGDELHLRFEKPVASDAEWTRTWQQNG